MCGCGSGNSSVGLRSSFKIKKSSTEPCRARRKQLIKIKKKALHRYSLEKDQSDLDVYNRIVKDLNNLSYCPSEEVINIYNNEYGL